MTLLEPIAEVNPDWLTDFALGELERGVMAGEDLYLLKVEEPLLVVGLRHGSLVRTPEMWVFLCKAYRPPSLKWSRRMVDELLAKYHKVQVWVRTDFDRGVRFAKAHGFVPERLFVWEGVSYVNMVARAKWA